MDLQTDIELLAALRALIEHRVVQLEVEAAKLDHMDSPVGVQSESTRWFAALILACAAAFWFGGAIGGGTAAAASVALWFAWVRPNTHRRIAARVHDIALRDTQVWRTLWRFGGVRLRAGNKVCSAPADNWMQLVREHADALPGT